MAKQLNIDLSFRADTSQAKAQIQELQKALSEVAKLPANSANLFDDVGLRKASEAALELEQHLSKAVNVDTGKLDLSRFSSSLKASNKDLSAYCQTLLSTGEKGRQAFLQLAQAIATADTPVTRINNKIAELGTTLKNTARWQLSSSILHGFMGAIQSAYGYAQDLNESLNNIRIVTGASIEQMDKFAKKANEAAKALSTTTTEYTNASLIYYQQGLSDSEVAARTEVTIKMANAAGESAQIVSDQMTAVWNNFYDGSKTLEYYADVMTALGAATASSTDEIAEGLNKFAAVAETVGLSYEYAASALATVTATTRQSADVVGTAFKTLFARIQDLELGKTLDDGTTLGSYSEALNKVGINIKDTSGELKDMDVILEEMASKWDTLGKAEQVALAQSVAGVRQYTQLIALMDNWDFMESNLATSMGAEGTLDQQAQIYAESWEAAQDRVTAAAENIYAKLLDDDFFIGLLNGFEKVLDTLGGFIDGLGGLGGVVSLVTTIFMTSFAQKMPQVLENLRQNFMVFSGQAQKEMVNVQAALDKDLAIAKADPNASMSYKLQIDGISQVNKMKQALVLESKNLTEAEREEYEMKIKNVEAMYKEIAALGEKADAAEKASKKAEKSFVKEGSKGVSSLVQDFNAAQDRVSTEGAQHTQALKSLEREEQELNSGETSAGAIARLEAIESERQAHQNALAEIQQKAQELDAQLSSVAEKYGLSNTALQEMVQNNGQLSDQSIQKISYAAGQMSDNFKKAIKHRAELENLSVSVKGQAKSWMNAAAAIKKYIASQNGSKKAMKTVTSDIDKMKTKMSAYLQKITELAKSKGIKLSSEDITKMSEKIEKMNPDNILQVTKSFNTFASDLDAKIGPKVSAIDRQIDSMRTDMADMNFDPTVVSEMEQTAEASADIGIELDNARENAEGFGEEAPKGMFSASTAVMQFGSAMMSANMVINSVQSAISVFSDEGATGFEKIGAAVSVLTSIMGAYNSVQALTTTLKKSDTIQTWLQAASAKVKTAADSGETVGIWAKVAAYIAEQAAAWPVLVVTLLIVAAFAALAAIITIVVAVVNAISDAYNKDAIAAEKAAATAQALKEAYEETKQAYEDMIAAMEEYKTAREGLDSLTEGTEEYKAALEEANRAALELINNHPELFSEDDYKWENGQLIIDEGAMEQAQQKMSTRETTAYTAMQMGAVEAKHAQNKADSTDIRREVAQDVTLAGDTIGSNMFASYGTSVALGLVPVIGPFLSTASAAIEGVSHSVRMAADAAMAETGMIDKVAAAYAENKNLFNLTREQLKAELNINDDNLINALLENKDSIIELSNNIEEANMQERLAAEQSAAAIIDKNSALSGSGYKDAMIRASGEKFSEAQSAAYDEILAAMDDKGTLEHMADSYFRDQGISDQSGFEVEKYDAEKGTVSYSYIDEEGERQTKEITAEQIAMTQAVIIAEQQLVDACSGMVDTFKKLDEDIANTSSDTSDESAAIKSFLTTGDTKSLTKEQYDTMAGMDAAQMEQYLSGMGITAENLADFGYGSTQEMMDDMDLASTGDQWAQYDNILAAAGASAGSMTLDSAENIQSATQDISDFYGEETGTQMLDMAAAMADTLDEAGQAEFWEQLGNIDDYADADQWEEFMDAMKDSGDLTEEQIKQLENYVDTSKLAAKATKQLKFEDLAENLKSLGSIMDGLAEGKRDFSEEEVLKLEEMGIDTSQFAKTVDGFRFLGDAGDMAALIGQNMENQINDANTNFENIAARARQAHANVAAAEGELAAARDNAAAAKEAMAQEAADQMTATQTLGAIMKSIIDTVGGAIKSAFEWLGGILLKIYDFFVMIFNAIGKGLSTAWNALIGFLEKLIEGVANFFVEIADWLGFDVEKVELDFQKANFTEAKTSEEIAAEQELAKAQEEAAAADAELAAAMTEMSDTIQASADYKTEDQLKQERADAVAKQEAAQKTYDETVAKHGEGSAEAKAAKQDLDWYNTQVEAYDKALGSKFWADVAAEGLDSKAVQDYADALQETNGEMVETQDEANRLAAAHMKVEKGMNTLVEKWGDWDDALKNGNAREQAVAMDEMRESMSDILNVDVSQISDDFLKSEKAMKLMEQAANGDAEALDRLGMLFAKQYIMDIDVGDTKLEQDLLGLMDQVQQDIENGDLTIGTSLDTSGYAMAMTEMMAAAGTDIETINNILAGMGFEPEVTYVNIPVDEYSTMKSEGNTQWTDSEGNKYTAVLDTTLTADENGMIQVPVINGSKTTFTGQRSAQTSSKSKGGGGGGGGSKKKADKAKKSDTVERYKRVTDQLDDNADAMERASRAADRLYGKDRLDKMRQANDLLKKELDLTKQKRKEAEKYLEIDKDELNKAASEAGISFTYDDKGNISNYEEAMTQLYEELDSAINKANADGNADEKEQEAIDAIQTKIDNVKDAMSTYEDTRELIEDLDTELEEKLHEWQDANFDILNAELELKIEINEMDLERIEYYLDKMEDDFYQMAEAAALMVMNASGDGFGGQLTSYMDQLQHQEDYLDKLHKQYAAGEISQANYIEGLKNASSAIYEQLGNLQELDSTMMEYYSDTLAAAGEEIAKYTELMENASGVLDHYASIAEMLGKSTDYKYMGKILQAQADVASNAYKVSKANYEMLKKQEDERKQAYDAAVARNASESELEMLEKQWWDARAAANEAQDTMLSDVETWAEALKAVLENSIADFGQELENTLTAGYGSFDAMTSAFERKNALQEEYLTTTNKIYETNKMMRTAQQEIDKTTNEAAKRRLKQFINETDALQDQTKLSQYELDIQQAKYDLLLAEIALEEAQNAKSTVRLQRDNEGNMSYVYTADQNKIADAQQKVEDAQNALYNKGLEGANDYVEKYQETMQEMYDTLTEIQQNYLDGAYESEEEYNNAIEEAKEYYYEKLTQYSNLYQVALTTDTRVAADAWTTEFASMTENTEDWMTAVNGYVGDVQGAFTAWKSQMDTIEKETLGNMDETLSNIVSDSEDLAETVTDDVIPALEREMDAVKDVTDKYATFRETLESITKEYEAMAKAAEDAVKATNGLEDGTNTGGSGDGSGDQDNDDNNNDDDNNDDDNNDNENNGSGNSSTLTWDRVKAVYNAINRGKWGTGSDRKKNGKAAGYTDEEIAKGQELINKVYGGMSLAAAKTALGFASGGYTGNWTGAYGKLAFLHQKELILNQHDTENFLASMEILERILQMIDLQATSAQLGGILSTPKFSHSNEGILEQSVHIEASFPGVTDHNEVELAMTNLINTASQYANRK